ncbi:MAG: RES domain-containing protein [Dermatophilaceae bacterium]
MTVPAPPSPFELLTEVWSAGQLLYRVHGNRRRVSDFNPGEGNSTRWAFFGDPVVSVLYVAEAEEAAVSESIFHDLPLAGARVFPEDYLNRVAGRLMCDRDLRLAQFAGGGLRRLGARPATLTGTDADTVRWAEAAWTDTECDGVIWMSRHWNTSRAIVLFGDRVRSSSLHQDPSYARAFANPEDMEWLAELCAQVEVSFTPPS